MNKVLKNETVEVFAFVPSYNHAPFIEKCLRSIIKQTLPPKKLLVIDDGSKDDSVKIIEKVLRDCPFDAELIARENRGLCATLNQGFAMSDGEFFAYLGSDDVWLKEFLANQTALLKSRPNAGLAFSHAYLIDETDAIIDSTKNWTNYADGAMTETLLKGIIPASPGVVYRRSVLENFSWNEDSVLEDYEIYLKLSTVGEFARNDKVLCAWRQHGWNVSSDFPLMLEEWLKAQDRVADKLKISREELDKIQAELRFKATLDYIRHGRKSEAFQLFRENLKGAKSAAQIGKILFRLAIPNKIFEWNKQRKRLKNIEQNGKLEI